MKVLNFGSLNLDHVYAVDHIVQPGETIPSTAYELFAGGKGANQSVALARAGATVCHGGMIGNEGTWLRDKMDDEGIEVGNVVVADSPGGHAIIQVDASGQNSIVLFGGANQQISDEHVANALSTCSPGDVLLLQNEINKTAELIGAGRAAGLTVCFNPAPMTPAVQEFPLELVDILIVNEHEGAALAQAADVPDIAPALRQRWPDTRIVLTLGEKGVHFLDADTELHVAAYAVDAVDTTAAGDTFIGYFLAGTLEGLPVKQALQLACKAAALSVTKPGAMDSIPLRGAVETFVG
ncbi:MAG: ribokinase [Lentisphaerae bacterium]|jgi:ribokinase|nr:ribokinase [Lentisphaerota bacterium]MBT4820058.1 ribokinase [Lentisphaerota bacterium]MBT5606283.1 ribokinase [Lentisphaerota bacterium]MBT7059377.1 ribokinase [Lentisphaerota bacterium]MBT7848272.1 ribokinase [Lentisphaerota bacterium]